MFLRPIDSLGGRTIEYSRVGVGQLSHSFTSMEDLKYESWRSDDLPWSNRPVEGKLPLPPDMFDLTLVTIR